MAIQLVVTAFMHPDGCFYYGTDKEYETDLLPRLAYYEEN